MQTPPSRSLELSLPKGFRCAQGPIGLRKKYSKHFRLSSVFAATEARPPYWRGTESRISVDLRFNQNLDPTQSVPLIQLTPAIDDLTVSVYRNALRLTGPFDRGNGSYEAIVQGDVRAIDGEVLPAGASYVFRVPKRRPTVSFLHSKGFLSPRGNLSMDLKTSAVGNLIISAQKVYRNNLANQLRGSWRIPQKEVAKKELLISRKGNEVVQSVLDLKALLGQPRGVYRLQAEATDARWTDDDAFVTITDLGLTTKRSAKGVFAWVTSLSQAAPIENALVSVISDRNQLLAQGKTNSQGIVEIDAPADHPDGRPWLVTVEKGEDLSYRLLNQRKWHLADVDQGGRDPVEAYDLFLYPERGVFRPGDAIRLTGILRDPQGNTPPEFPLEMRAWQPDGRKVRTWTVDSLQDGVFHAEFNTREDGQTGPYRFAAGLPGASTHFGEITILVEAFEPVRVEAVAKAEKPIFGQNEKHLAILSSRYLFGQPAACLPYVVNGRYHRVSYKSKRFPRYRFEILDGESFKVSSQRAGATDEEGRAEIFLDQSRVQHLAGLWEGRFHATVTIPGGRSVSDRFTFRANPLGRHLGLAFPENFPPPADESFNLGLVMVDDEDHPMDSHDTEVMLERVNRNWVLQEVDGSRVWRRQDSFTLVLRKELSGSLASNPVRSLALSCPSAGTYRITARDMVNGARAQARFYVSAYENESDPALASPHRVTLKLEKDSFLPGESVRVRVAAPFAGRLLLTLE
ncbi:MAG: MG2 domain-containing protein, partial [Opitutales bacterium]